MPQGCGSTSRGCSTSPGLHADLRLRSLRLCLRPEWCRQAAVQLLTHPGSHTAPCPAAPSPARTHAPAHRGDSQHKRGSTKHRVRRRGKNSWCYAPLSSDGMKIFQMRGSGRACESLSKPILPASTSSPLSEPHTHPILSLQTLSNLRCPSVRVRKNHFPLLHIVQLQLLSHQHGPAQRMTKADMLGDCSFPAHPTKPLGPMMRKSLRTPCSSLQLSLYLNPAWKTPLHTA